MRTLIALSLAACATASQPAPDKLTADKPAADKLDTSALVSGLVQKHGEAQRARIERGVKQVAAYWRAEDGDLKAFVEDSFADDPAPLQKRFAMALEQLDGHFLE